MFLTSTAFAKAAEYLREFARPVEEALFYVFFEDGDPSDVDEELADYQNEDGGFGHALDPDLRCPESSVAATVAALLALSDTGAPPDSDIVGGGVEFLLGQYDAGRGGWPKVPPAANAAPHAEWWHQPDGAFVAETPRSWPIVNVDAIAVLHDYPMLVPAELLEDLTRLALERLHNLPDDMDMHAFAAYRRLALRLDDQRRPTVMARLTRSVEQVIERDVALWTGHVATPLWLAPSPDLPFARVFAAELERNLVFEVSCQQADGSWRPRRRWGTDPELCALVEQEGAGIITLQTLRVLRAHRRIAA